MSSNTSKDPSESNVIPLPQPDGAVSSDLLLKVIAALVVLGGAFGGTAYMLDDRAKDQIEKHSERPHVGAASREGVKELREDVKELRGEVAKQATKTDQKLERILDAVAKK